MKIAHADVRRKKALKVLLFGDSGTGKTHLALKAFPGKTLIFDAESGADFFEGRKDFDFDYVLDDEGLKTSSIKELQNAIKYLATDEGRKKYDMFIIDPISDIWDNIQAQRGEYKDVMNSRKDERKQRVAINDVDLESFNQKDWADMKRVYKNMMLDLKNLPQNVVLIAREKEISETKADGNIVKTGEYTYEGEKSTKYAVDFNIRLTFDEKSNKRYAYVVKSRAEGAEKGERIQNPTFAIFDKVVNSMADGKTKESFSTKEENIFDEEEKNDNKESALSDLKELIISACKELGGSSNQELMSLLKEYTTSGNPNKITDLDKAKELFGKLSEKLSNKDKTEENE